MAKHKPKFKYNQNVVWHTDFFGDIEGTLKDYIEDENTYEFQYREPHYGIYQSRIVKESELKCQD